MKAVSRAVVFLLQLPIRAYRLLISPWLPRGICRFYPTCSVYALEALEKHGPVKGLYLTARRLLRCQPFHPGGVDVVPPPDEGSA